MDESQKTRPALFRLGTAFFEHLPAWFVFVIGTNAIFGALTFFDPPRRAWAWTGLFPEAVVLFYFFCRFKAGGWSKRAGLKLAGICAVQIAAFLAIWLLAEPASFAQDVASWSETLKQLSFPPPPGTKVPWFAGRDILVLLFEIHVLVWTVLFMLHIYHHKRLGGLMFFFGPSLLFGMLLESNGMMMKFFFEYDYHVYLPPFHAPLVTMFSWPPIFYTCAWVWHAFQDAFPPVRRGHWLWGAGGIAVLGIMIDLAIDPMATNLTFWTWNSKLQSGPGLLGVPVLNFVSWFFAVGTFGAFYLYLTRDGKGAYAFGRRRDEIIEADRRLYEGKPSAGRRSLAWLAAVPKTLRDRPLRRAADSWRSDKGLWTHLARNLTMILVIPVMKFVAGLGVLATIFLIEGLDSPLFEILRNR